MEITEYLNPFNVHKKTGITKQIDFPIMLFHLDEEKYKL